MSFMYFCFYNFCEIFSTLKNLIIMRKTTLKFFTATLAILFNLCLLNAQTTVTWPLTNPTAGTGFDAGTGLTVNPALGTGFTAADQTQSVLTAISWTGFATDGLAHCQRVKTTDATRSIPLAFDASTYVEYAITAATGYDLSVSQIHMYLGGGGTSSVFAQIFYSTDNFATSTTLDDGSVALGSNTATVITDKNFSSLTVPVLSGSTLKVRVYPKNTGGASTTKYLISNNVSVTFTSAVSTATGVQNPGVSGVSFDGKMIQNNENLDVQVYDVTGHKMFSSNKNIDMSSCANGIYIAKSTNGTLKFVLYK